MSKHTDLTSAVFTLLFVAFVKQTVCVCVCVVPLLSTPGNV